MGKKSKMKIGILLMSIVLLCGCSMTIRENPDGSITLKGFGSGKGELKDKGTVEKGLITFPPIKLER